MPPATSYLDGQHGVLGQESGERWNGDRTAVLYTLDFIESLPEELFVVQKRRRKRGPKNKENPSGTSEQRAVPVAGSSDQMDVDPPPQALGPPGEPTAPKRSRRGGRGNRERKARWAAGEALKREAEADTALSNKLGAMALSAGPSKPLYPTQPMAMDVD